MWYPRIRVVSRDEQKMAVLARRHAAHVESRLELRIADVRIVSDVQGAIDGTDAVVLMAAMKHVDICEQQPAQAIRTNVLGAMNLALGAQMARGRLKKVVTISTDKAVDPINVYGMSKAIAERVLMSAELPLGMVTVVRYGNVLYSNGSVLRVAEERVARGEPMLVTSPDMTRFLFTLEQAIDLIEIALSYEGTAVLVPQIRSCTVGELLRYALPEGYPMSVVGPRPGEKMHEALVSVDEVSAGVIRAVDRRPTPRNMTVLEVVHEADTRPRARWSGSQNFWPLRAAALPAQPPRLRSDEERVGQDELAGYLASLGVQRLDRGRTAG